MEEIQNQVERLIDDIERDSTLTKEDINIALNQLKTDIEDYNLERGDGRTLEWEDLD